MERVLSTAERIKRAEEIYNRRKMENIQSGVRVSYRETNKEKKINLSLFKRMILQILICLVIYFIFYLIQNTNYIFSENVLNKTKEILSYDMNPVAIYEETVKYFNQIIPKENQEENKTNNGAEENMLGNEITNQIVNGISALNVIPNTVEGSIGGPEVIPNEESSENLSQMEIDANEIKSKYQLQIPLVGTITSRFGLRNPTTKTVPTNHTGIDIAANVGTVIYAALDGTVTISSSEGDYGNHLRIEKDDVAIYYAHCSKLYVKQGDVIKQGDAIAEVGATGNVTGPHLHFEIRKQERYVNPDLVMQF